MRHVTRLIGRIGLEQLRTAARTSSAAIVADGWDLDVKPPVVTIGGPESYFHFAFRCEGIDVFCYYNENDAGEPTFAGYELAFRVQGDSSPVVLSMDVNEGDVDECMLRFETCEPWRPIDKGVTLSCELPTTLGEAILQRIKKAMP